MRMWPFSSRRVEKKAPTPAPGGVAVRSFDAAMFERTLSNWRWDGGFTNTEILSALPVIRSRSRDMAKNSPLYARYIQLMRENVVGDGFRFKALPAISLADPTSIDNRAAETLEYHWWKWATNPSAVDAGRRQNLTQILQLAVENWVRDGEAFIILDDTAQNRYGLNLRVVRSDCIDETVNFDMGEGRAVRGGVEFDIATGTPRAYWFNGSRADNGGVVYFHSKPIVRIEARRVIHLFERHEADQIRGVPLGYAALVPLKMLDEYTRAELVAARAEACTVGIFKSPYDSMNPAKFEVSDKEKDKAANMIREGQNLWLPPGFDFASHTPSHPNRAWADYSTNLQRLVATGLGVDFTELTGNASDAISVSVRQSILRTREMYKTRQRVVSSLVLDRLYHAWLRSFLSLAVSGDLTLADFERLSDHEFKGRRWGWIDPTAEVNAATIAVAHGWRTDAEVASDYGNDIDDDIKEAARVRPAKEAAGLVTLPSGQQPPQPQPTNESEGNNGQESENQE
ncbi:MAG: phage portal protein [Kiritimatiellae bacterium]|nr:phage portal protein [Kiritimatiellia bacterium]